MGKILKGKAGTSIGIVNNTIRNGINRITTDKKEGTQRDIGSFKSGKLLASDWKKISIGLEVLGRILNEGLTKKQQQLLFGEEDISKLQHTIIEYRSLMEDFIRRIGRGARDEYELQKRIENLSKDYEIIQAARDGIIIKQERRIENGEEKLYDTSMTPNEVKNILREYNGQAERLSYNKLNNYMSLGLGIAGMIGTLISQSKNKDEQSDGTLSLITLGTAAIGGLKLFQGVLKKDDKRQLYGVMDKANRQQYDLLSNEQISNAAQLSAIENIKALLNKQGDLRNKIENKRFAFDMILDLAVALISGAYINKQVQTKQNGKIDGKSLATAILGLQSAKGTTRNLVNSIQDIVSIKKDEEEFKRICEQLSEILKQMEEKVYPLEGAQHSFDSMKISNFTGRFYPKKDYDTGEINYSTNINIPEFSMQRGDVVLLSGESGTGKSTFLRFLKRGDINNRKAIELDGKEKVDGFGNEYISFKPSIDLGDETNVLYQITGKNNISDLTEEEKKNLLTMLGELKFNSPDLLEELASKKFMEFSTGQQRRLALSKIFYRINDGTSVIIVDEPVGNVEDSLIREQLEMIVKYAKNRNVMTILTTHRLDLAKDLVTKRYHIDRVDGKNSVLTEIPVQEQENNSDEIEI